MATARHVGLVVLGDTGVGKTWLVRLSLGHFDDSERIEQGGSVVLESRQTNSSVTQVTEAHEYASDDTSDTAVKVKVYNVPGLDEHVYKSNGASKDGEAAAAEKRERNKLELQKAFDETVNTYIFYVFGQSGGRISASAWANYHALKEAYEFRDESLCFVVNQIQNKGQETATYKAEQAVEIEEETGIANPRILFVDLVSQEPAKNRAEKAALLARIKNMLSHMAPAVHTQKHEVVMSADKLKQAEERYKQRDDELKAAQEAFKQQQEAMEKKTAELQQQVQEGKINAQQQSEAMEAFKKTQQDAQTDLQNKLNTAQQQVQQMQQQPQAQQPAAPGPFAAIGGAVDKVLKLFGFC